MGTFREDLAKQVKEAKAHVRKMKKICPGIYPEYLRMQSAKQRLAEAMLEYQNAKEAWNNLGKE